MALLGYTSLLIEFSGQWKHVIDIKIDKVNLEGVPLIGVQILSFSCSSQEKLAK